MDSSTEGSKVKNEVLNQKDSHEDVQEGVLQHAVIQISESYSHLQEAYAKKTEQDATDAEEARRYRFWIMVCIAGGIAVFYILLLIVLIRIFLCNIPLSITSSNSPYLYTVGLIIWAAIPTIMSIALIRYYFRPYKQRDDIAPGTVALKLVNQVFKCFKGGS